MNEIRTEFPKKLTPTLKKRITKDWKSLFPGLMIRKPMCLERRVGPLLIGIGLQPICEGELYRPGFSVHNLSRAWDFLTANLMENGRTITVRWHETNYHRSAAELKDKAWLPLEGPISLNMVIDAYKNYMIKRPYSERISQLEDPAMIASWAGEPEIAQDALEWGYQTLQTWSEPVQHGRGGAKAWREKLEKLISDPEALRQTTKEEVIKHKLTMISYEDFTDTSYKEAEL